LLHAEVTMALLSKHGRPIAEDVTDVEAWLRGLPDCPLITATHLVACDNHGDGAADWFYVEADSAEGVARARCIGCGKVQGLLDSEEHWSYPPTWACPNCQQSIAQVVLGVHEPVEGPGWVAVALRCVDCGTISGVTDAVLDDPALPAGRIFAPASAPVA
jgi:hypothetical protein